MEITTIMYITFTLIVIVIINLCFIAARDTQNSTNAHTIIPFQDQNQL